MSLGEYTQLRKIKGTGIGCNRHAVCGRGPGYKGGTVPCTLRDRNSDTPPSASPPGGPGTGPGTLVVPNPVGGDVLVTGVCMFTPIGFEYTDGDFIGRLIQSPKNEARYKVLESFTVNSTSIIDKDRYIVEYEFIEEFPINFDYYVYYFAPTNDSVFSEKKSVYGFDCVPEGGGDPTFHILDWRHYRADETQLKLVQFGGLFYPDADPIGEEGPHHDERTDDIEDEWSHERGTYEIIFPKDFKDVIVPDDILYVHVRKEKYKFSCFIPEPDEGEEPIPPDTPSLGKLLKKEGDGEWEEVHEFTMSNYENEVEVAYDNETLFSYEPIEAEEEVVGINLGGWYIEPDPEAESLVVRVENQMDIFDPLDPTFPDDETVPNRGYKNLRYDHAYLEISQLKYTRFFVMIWIDEAQYVYNNNENDTAEYDQDLVAFIEVMELHKSRASLMTPYDGAEWQGWEKCIPNGYSPPVIDGLPMPMLNISRQEALHVQELIDLYEGWTVDFSPRRVLLAVDESGSMSTYDIEPAFTEFKAYLDSHSVPYEGVTFGNERWLHLTTEKIIEWAQ